MNENKEYCCDNCDKKIYIFKQKCKQKLCQRHICLNCIYCDEHNTLPRLKERLSAIEEWLEISKKEGCRLGMYLLYESEANKINKIISSIEMEIKNN